MGRYTNIELEEMKKTEPERAFYFSHEDEFMQMGIDLTLDGWDSVLQTSMVPSPDENRYAFFMRSLRDGGITVLDDKNNLRKLQYDDTKKDPLVVTELKDSNEKIKSYTGDRPQEPKRPERPHLGFGTRLLQLITIGIYRPKALKEYDNNMQKFGKDLKSYEKAMENYKEAEEAFHNESLKNFRAKTYALKEYEKTLDERGKTQEMRNDYRKALKKNVEKNEAVNKEIALEQSRIEGSSTNSTLGKERLDLVFGSKLPSSKTEEMIDRCVAKKVFRKEHFAKPQPGEEAEKIKSFDRPKNCPFDTHEIALLGYAATCNSEILLKAKTQPDPNKPPMEGEMTEGEKLGADVLWYNFTEGIVTRAERESAASIPLINYAKQDAMTAIEQYMNGNPDALGKIICNGIHRTVTQVSISEDARSSCAFPDYGRICGELLRFVDKNRDPKLYDAVIKAGLKPEDIEAAKVCFNIGAVYDKGINALRQLANGELTDEQRLSATADVAALRLTQQVLTKRYLEYAESPELAKKTKQLEDDVNKYTKERNRAKKDWGKAKEDGAANLAETEKKYKEANKAFTNATHMIAAFQTPIVAMRFGFDTTPNKDMRILLGSDDSPRGLHDMFAQSDTFKNLAKQPGKKILREMWQTNAEKYLKKVQAENKKPVGRNSVQKAAQRQNVLG